MSTPPPAPDLRPYRALFPLGVLFAVLGAGAWLLFAVALIGYPGPFHRTLMIQGFQHSFVVGFLLTAMPGLTRGERCRRWELATIVVLQVIYGVAAAGGLAVLAHAAYLASVVFLLVAFARRASRAGVPPADEVLFAAFGMVLGMIGGALSLAVALHLFVEPVPRFSERVLSLGTVLSLVLGVGGLLVPTFAGIRDPASLPTPTTKPRLGRRVLYGMAIAGLAGSFLLDALRRPDAGMWMRALAAAVVALAAWKIWRTPRNGTWSAWLIWSAAWLVVIGLVFAAAAPRLQVGALHVTFIGGYGLLTFGVASRVAAIHGGAGEHRKAKQIGIAGFALIASAVLLRVAAELVPLYLALLAAAAIAWSAAWIGWAFTILARRPAAPRIAP